MESLDDFITMLNNNDQGISLQHESSKTEIHFLDLQIKVLNGMIVTSMYFKEPDRY